MPARIPLFVNLSLALGLTVLSACSSVQSTSISSEPIAPTPSPAKAEPESARFVGSDMPNTQPQTSAAVVPAGHNAQVRSPRVSMAPLGLFGQVSDPVAPRSSSMDGIDSLMQITAASEGDDFDPAIDPTGTTLAFASTQHRATSDIYLKPVRGNTLTQLTNDPANDVMPAFSPDGQHLAFASDRAGNWDIYLINLKGGQPIQITNDPTHDIHPSFSPDGKQVVYCTYGAQSGQWEMVIIDVENPTVRRFIGYGLFPTWSPASNPDRILFQRARERGTRWFSLWTVDLVNGEATRPTEIAASSNAAVITPRWSPDGSRVVFCTVVEPTNEGNPRPSQADIWVAQADGSNRINLTNSTFANLQPIWSSDGSIYFVSNRGKNGTENIWALRPTTLSPVQTQTAQMRTPQPAKPMTPAAPVSAHVSPAAPAPVTAAAATDTGHAPATPVATAPPKPNVNLPTIEMHNTQEHASVPTEQH